MIVKLMFYYYFYLLLYKFYYKTDDSLGILNDFQDFDELGEVQWADMNIQLFFSVRSAYFDEEKYYSHDEYKRYLSI